MSYQNRIITKANFLLGKFMFRSKAYPCASIYRRWMEDLPEYPFAYKEVKMATSATSRTSGGDTIPQIISSKRRSNKNFNAVIAFKTFYHSKMHKDPNIDQLGSLIAMATLNHYQHPPVVKEVAPEAKVVVPVVKVVTPPPSPTKPKAKPKTEIIKIEMPEDDEDWSVFE